MPEITVRTRDNANPAGKPKIYLCAHPDDREAHLARVISEIWEACDVAICYHQEPFSCTGDEDLCDLQEMRMLVLIVTNRFLTQPCAARDRILPFFEKRHIQVLPLVREQVSDALFTQVLGERQYLSACVQDDTALPYEYKLKRFFQLIMPDDRTVARIQNAFCSHIFISYRKVDRAEARRLIGIIRDDQACRDAAIWYDEFLTPGEDFNKEIADAIRKCDLFAMAITPNTLADQNYIIHTEYPFAKQHGKRVLPVECVPTDRAQLKEHFAGIPACVAHDDTAALTAALSDALGAHAKESDPQRDYLIGLAHLYGIGAEPNVTRAFSRIATAARAGLVEAHLKLAEMHWDGNGVPVNRQAALNVMETLLCRQKHQHQTAKSPEVSATYAKALARMAEMLCEMGKYEQALPHAKQARQISSDLSLKDNAYDLLCAEHALLLGEIHFYLGNTGKGSIYLLEAFAYGGSDQDEEYSAFWRRFLTLSLVLFRQSSSLDKDARKAADKMVEIAQFLYDESGSTFDKTQLLQALSFAMAHKEKGDEQRALCERALSLVDTTSLSHLSESVQLQAAHAYVYGAACAQTEQEYEARIQKALDIVLAHPHSITARQYASTVYFTKYAHLQNAGQHASASFCLERAVTFMRDVVKETASASDYKALFKLEYMQYPEHMQSANAYLQFQLERWEAAYKAHPESKAIRKAYRARRRTWRWRWIVLPYISKRSKNGR